MLAWRHPVDDTAPVCLADQHDRYHRLLACLHQREYLEQLVTRAEATCATRSGGAFARLAKVNLVRFEPRLYYGDQESRLCLHRSDINGRTSNSGSLSLLSRWPLTTGTSEDPRAIGPKASSFVAAVTTTKPYAATPFRNFPGAKAGAF